MTPLETRPMGKWSLERTLMVACLLFTLGINWQKVVGRDDDVAHLKAFTETTLPDTYVRKDIYELDRQHVAEAITQLTKTLEKLYALEEKRGEPAQLQRMFDK